jgi:chromosomal replication initiator protein DnaA
MEELNPRFTFETLVVGAANRLAVTAARTVGEAPGTAYNPLFVYGGSGLGKTHLLMAIGHLARELRADIDVEYVTLNEFVELYQAAVAAGQTDALRSRLARADVLLVDDVHFLARRHELQAELLRLVEQLQGANRQIVLTSDRPPTEIQDLDDRLISRFDGGLVVDIDTPEFETRLAILRRGVADREVAVEAEVLEVIAGTQVQSVRELIGLLNRFIAFQAVSEIPLTAAAAGQLLAGQVPATPDGQASALPQDNTDEFAAFLSGISHTVQEQVDVWRHRVQEAISQWASEGYRTDRLERLLRQEVPSGIERTIREYERDIDRLRGFQRAMARVDPQRVSEPEFFDPDRLKDADELVQAALREGRPPPGPSPAWTMADLVTGGSNRVAMSAAAAVIATPGAVYNPLVLQGPDGVGKTHLLHAIGNALGKHGTRVACLTAQEFVDELLDAIDGDRIDGWRRRYRGTTALLIDDVQLLAGKERSQEELFHLYNRLLTEGRQLVFTIGAPPSEVPGLDPRLVSRLQGGLIAPIGPPDRDVRRGLASARLAARYGDADPDVAEYLAESQFESLRALVNAIQRLVRMADAEGTSPTLQLARTVLEGVPRTSVSTRPVRTSGMGLSLSSALHSHEKVVWEWPELTDRIVEVSA